MSDSIYILTPEFRVSFPNVFTPRQFKGKGDAKYSLNAMFPKDTDLSELKQACKDAAKARWGDDLQGIKWPFKDGDVRAAKDPKFEMYKGMFWISTSTTIKPQIVAQDAKTYIRDDKGAFYPGVWARAELHTYTYEGEQRGVSLGLGNIQKVRDDTSFGGRPDAKDQFNPIESGADDASNYDGGDDMIDSEVSEEIEL